MFFVLFARVKHECVHFLCNIFVYTAKENIVQVFELPPALLLYKSKLL